MQTTAAWKKQQKEKELKTLEDIFANLFFT